MKIMKSILAILLLASTFVSCKKDKAESGKQIQGTWVGKWGDQQATPTSFISFQINRSGTLKRLNQQGETIAEGTWSLDGIEFTCIYTHTDNGETHKIKGIYTDFDGGIMGTWGYSPSSANGGTVELSKQ